MANMPGSAGGGPGGYSASTMTHADGCGGGAAPIASPCITPLPVENPLQIISRAAHMVAAARMGLVQRLPSPPARG